jgi:uncharacterized membrane protein
MSSLELSLPPESGKHFLQNGSLNAGRLEKIATALTGAAVVGYGLKQRSPAVVLFGLLGTALAYQCVRFTEATEDQEGEEIARDYHVAKSITVNQTPEQLYKFWRQLENLPRFVENLESVTQLDEQRSHWVVTGPGNTRIEWDAEVFNEKENELIAWRSLSGSDLTNAGTVRFAPADGRGTRVEVTLNYNAPGGKAGMLLAKLWGEEPGQLIELNLRRLKRLLETGEIPTIAGQPSGGSTDPAPERKADKLARKAAAGGFRLHAGREVA